MNFFLFKGWLSSACSKILLLMQISFQLSVSQLCRTELLSFRVLLDSFLLPFLIQMKKILRKSFLLRRRASYRFFSLKVSSGSPLFGLLQSAKMWCWYSWHEMNVCFHLQCIHIESFCCREDPRGHMLIQTRLKIIQIFLGEWNYFLCLYRVDIRSFSGGNLALPLQCWSGGLSWAAFK